MIEIIVEFIVSFFVEVIFQGIVLGIFRGVKLIGLIVLKLLTLSKNSIEELKEKYKDSSKPYFVGIGASIGMVYMIIELIN
jgi:hypothetical protein